MSDEKKTVVDLSVDALVSFLFLSLCILFAGLFVASGLSEIADAISSYTIPAGP